MSAWYAPGDIRSAQKWEDAIGRALDECDWMVVLVSSNSAQSKWVKREVSYALRHDQYEERITPVCLDDTNPEKVSWVLGAVQSVKWCTPPNVCLQQILDVWAVTVNQDCVCKSLL